MRFEKLTIKSQELIQNAQSLASAHNHQQIEPEHILSAMLNEPQGIARSMLDKLGVSGDDVFRELAAAMLDVDSVLAPTEGGSLTLFFEFFDYFLHVPSLHFASYGLCWRF